MFGQSKAVFVLVFLALAFGVDSESKVINKRDIWGMDANQVLAWACQQVAAWNMDVCKTTAKPTSSSSTAMPTTTQSAVTDESSSTLNIFTSDTTANSSSTTPSPSALERAHWCRLTNGTFLPANYTFMNTPCTLCQCTADRSIRCAAFHCMSAYCIDNSQPAIRPGQCCAQCSYEQRPMSCVYNGYTFPHGTLVKTNGDALKCWCQYGNIECRQSAASPFSDLDLFGSGTAIYIIVIIVFAILMIGTLLCCGCTVLYYYYYKRNQESVQAAYEQYWGTAGWQPMNEEGYVVDSNAEEKQAEAEQGQNYNEYPTGSSEAYIPPPYALYNGTYINENATKEQ